MDFKAQTMNIYNELNPNSPLHSAIKALIDMGYVQSFRHDDTGKVLYSLTDAGEKIVVECAEEYDEHEMEKFLKKAEEDLRKLL